VGPSHRSEALCVESKIGCALIGMCVHRVESMPAPGVYGG
jgi:hypothetical protein